MDKEQRAKEQAYAEYLSLRENKSTRGKFVKNDDLYGSYFSGGNHSGETKQASAYRGSGPGGSIENTPYGASQMRRDSQARQSERDEYLAMRASEKGKKPIARKGRKNKADDEDELSRGGYGGAKAGKKGKKSQKKKGRGLKIALLVVLILVIGIGGVVAAGLVVVKNTLDNVGRVELDPDLIGINPQVDSDLRNYRNIALLGIDARDMSNDKDVRSDAIIIASVNKETNEIKMFSVYRDTYLYLGEDVGLDKITHAYYYGGPTKVLYALNKNLDLNIKEVVVVNWKSVADTVDALDGLDIEIQQSEIKEMNKYIIDTYNNIGGSNELIEAPGMQTLNGNQAVTYARIRKDAVTGDYRRNERMKIVVKAAFDKALQMKPKAIKQISGEILPQVKTNMSTADMMGMALDLTSYNMTDSVGFPYETRDWSSGAFYGVPATLESNVSQLHEQFFAQEGYAPTQDVREISSRISRKTGIH